MTMAELNHIKSSFNADSTLPPGLADLYLFTVNHKTAPISVREQFSIQESNLKKAYEEIKKRNIFNSFLFISTCNRTEVYFKTSDFNLAIKNLILFFKDFSNLDENIAKEYGWIYCHADVVNHAFNLASGLDSLIVGERQILSQLKYSFSVAQEYKTLDGTLENLFKIALSCAKEIHQSTDLSKGKQSISSAAVDILDKIYGPLSTKNILVLGAGRMAELALERITDLGGGKNTYVLNRSPHKTIEFSDKYKIDKTFPFDDIYKVLNEIDLVICAAGAPHFILFANLFKLERLNWNRRLTIIDISLPRNIDSAFNKLPNVELIDIDRLQKIYNEIFYSDKLDLNDVNELIDSGKESFYDVILGREKGSLIKDIKEKVENIRLSKLSQILPDKESYSKEEVEYITKNILNTVMHLPFSKLKDASISQGIKEKVLRELFEIN